MESIGFTPGKVFTVIEYRADGRVLTEHIFVGDILDETIVKQLNNGRKDPSHRDIKDAFTQYNIKYDKTRSIQKYYNLMIEPSDSFSTLYYKLSETTKINTNNIYVWNDNFKYILTHNFEYRSQFVKIKGEPFSRDKQLDKIFSAFGNLKFTEKSKHLIRSALIKDDNVLKMISKNNIETYIENNYPDIDPKIILYRYFPPQLQNLLGIKPYYSISENQCFNKILRNNLLPVKLNEKSQIDWKFVKIDNSQIEQCTIHIKNELLPTKENQDPDDSNIDIELASIKPEAKGSDSFINLETIFQLMPMEDEYIFVKMKKGDRSISKVSKEVQKYKREVTKDILTEWVNIEEHHRGLMYRKLKSSPGLVIYRIYDNGFIELQFNWTKTINLNDQLKEIIIEVMKLNQFIDEVNDLNFQLPGHESKLIEKADPNFIKNPQSNTRFTMFNFKTIFDTNKQQIDWNAFNFLSSTFKSYLLPIFNWRVFNMNELRRLTSGLTEANLFYVKTDNNLTPDPLTSIIYSLGLVGSIDKEQTISVERQKDLIVEFKNRIYKEIDGNSDDANIELDLTKEMIDERIQTIKDGNPGVLINIKLNNDKYYVHVKGAHNLMEIREINSLLDRIFKFYFHINAVYKFIKNYNCNTLSWLLNNSEKIDIQKLKDKKKKSTQLTLTPQIAQDEEVEMDDLFNIGDTLDSDEIIIPDTPQPASKLDPDDDTPTVIGEVVIPTNLGDLAEIEDVKSGSERVKSALDYLKDISGIFKTEYRRYACTDNHPVVISVKDFWRNYGRLTKRFQQIKNQLKPKDLETYNKKFQKEIETKDQSLEKHRKRVLWVAKRLEGTSKTIVNEIADIFERYERGAQMKVPLDKSLSKYSQEYFYFCPRKWCYFCRESKLSDEINNNTKKGDLCKVCQNNLYILKDMKNKYIGFPDSKKHVHLNCLPCCFKASTKFDKKKGTCNLKHPTKKITKEFKKVDDVDVNHILSSDIIPEGRIGYLDGQPDGKLNDFFNEGQTYINRVRNNDTIIVKKGVNLVDERDAFLEALSYIIIDLSNKLTPDQIRQNIIERMNMEIFRQLNNGLIFSIFKRKDITDQEALDEFKNYLETEYLNEEILWHLTAYPGFFTDQGYNLLIINRSTSPNSRDHKYTLLCPTGINISDYFNPNLFTAILLKLENGIYYPLIKVSCEIDLENIISCTREIQQYIFHANTGSVKRLLDHAMDKCSIGDNPFEENRLDLYKTINELDKTEYLNREKLELIINFYNQVVFIKLQNEDSEKSLLFPIKSTPMPTPGISDIYNEFDDLFIDPYSPPKQGELVSLKDASKMIKEIGRRTKIPLKLKNYVKDFQDFVYGIKLDNGLIIMFQKQPLKLFKPENKDLPIIEEEANDVDISINKIVQNQIDKRHAYVNKTTFQKESFQRLRFEISRYLPNNKDVKTKIMKIVETKNTLDNKRKDLEKIMKNIIENIAVIQIPDLSNYKLPQIRNQCSNTDCASDPHCVSKGNKCYVILPQDIILPNDTIIKNTIERYVVLISDEILRNAIKRSELLDGKVSIYVNPSQMVYDVKKEMLVNDPDYENQIADLYAKSVNYLDLLDKHYFIKESEVFTRQVERHLFYLPSDSWYKNTGLSKNDFVINTKNAYDVLNDVLKTDLGDQMWEFIDRHNWRLWLNAFRSIKPDEFENIYQRSQFMEHIKYGKSTITKLHLALISRLQNIKIILMNRNAIGNRKFDCLNTTQASSTSNFYLIFYKYDDNNIYLVGRTPHIDLNKTEDVIYRFKESKIPSKFFKMWSDHCTLDHKLQQKPDPYDILIKEIPVIKGDLDMFVDDLVQRPDIKDEEIIEGPSDIELTPKEVGTKFKFTSKKPQIKINKPIKPKQKLKFKKK